MIKDETRSASYLSPALRMSAFAGPKNRSPAPSWAAAALSWWTGSTIAIAPNPITHALIMQTLRNCKAVLLIFQEFRPIVMKLDEAT